MPHTIYVPAYTEDGRMITDQRTLRIMNEERTPEDDRRDYESLKAKRMLPKPPAPKQNARRGRKRSFRPGPRLQPRAALIRKPGSHKHGRGSNARRGADDEREF